MASTGASTHTTWLGQEDFERALRFGLNSPRELADIYLTALARLAQWAGFYVRGHDAIGATSGFTILTGTAFISRCAPLISH